MEKDDMEESTSWDGKLGCTTSRLLHPFILLYPSAKQQERDDTHFANKNTG